MTSGVRIWGVGFGERIVCALERWVDGACRKDEVDCTCSDVVALERAGEDADANIVFSSARPRFGVGDSVLARERPWSPIEANRSLIEIEPGRDCRLSSGELPLSRGWALDVVGSSWIPVMVISLIAN